MEKCLRKSEEESMSDVVLEKKEGEIVAPSWEKFIYPGAEAAGGIYKAYFSSYINLLAATVYVFSAQIVWLLELLEAGIQWLGAPILGPIYDRFSFKNGKFWPWWILFGCGTGILYLIFFAIPAFVPNPGDFGALAMILIVFATFSHSGTAILGVTQCMYQGRDEKTRAFMGMRSNFCRNCVRMIVGFVFPVALLSFNKSMPETHSYALFTAILVFCAVIGFILVAMATKRSTIEVLAKTQKMETRKKRNILHTFKAIVTPPPLLIMFLAMLGSKIFFFWVMMGGAFFWRFYMRNFGMFALWNLFIGFATMTGCLLIPIIKKFLPDTKRAYVAAFCIQAVVYLISMFVVSPDNPWGTVIIIPVALFFNSITDGLILPMFGIAAEAVVIKSGERDYGLSMSVYSLSIRVGSVVGLSIRMGLLIGAGFNTAALAAGEATPAAVMDVFKNYISTWPFFIILAIILLVGLGFRLNDAKAAQLRKDFEAKWGHK